ncbi:hypothetical protein BOX15_Mlig014280g1, partial [Macrostomum lignano]
SWSNLDLVKSFLQENKVKIQPEAARQCNELIRLFAEECAVRAAGAAKARLAVAETKQKQ